MEIQLLDIFQFACWSFTYLLIIILGIKYKECYMPPIASFLNFSWEIAALIIDFVKHLSLIIIIFHLTWIILDAFIIIITIKLSINKMKSIFFYSFVPFMVASTIILFKYIGQLEICFLIDIIMALSFVFCMIKINKNAYSCIIIGILKLLGDYFAYIVYSTNIFVYYIGKIVLIINFLYLQNALRVIIKKVFIKI